jgi:hypothetical protein
MVIGVFFISLIKLSLSPSFFLLSFFFPFIYIYIWVLLYIYIYISKNKKTHKILLEFLKNM